MHGELCRSSLQRRLLLAAGLGFEDCSAKVTAVQDSAFAASGYYVSEHAELGPKASDFYKFNVSDEDYQIVVNIAGEKNGDSACESGLDYPPKTFPNLACIVKCCQESAARSGIYSQRCERQETYLVQQVEMPAFSSAYIADAMPIRM